MLSRSKSNGAVLGPPQDEVHLLGVHVALHKLDGKHPRPGRPGDEYPGQGGLSGTQRAREAYEAVFLKDLLRRPDDRRIYGILPEKAPSVQEILSRGIRKGVPPHRRQPGRHRSGHQVPGLLKGAETPEEPLRLAPDRHPVRRVNFTRRQGGHGDPAAK
jgi:hypothetical protein